MTTKNTSIPSRPSYSSPAGLSWLSRSTVIDPPDGRIAVEIKIEALPGVAAIIWGAAWGEAIGGGLGLELGADSEVFVGAGAGVGTGGRLLGGGGGVEV